MSQQPTLFSQGVPVSPRVANRPPDPSAEWPGSRLPSPPPSPPPSSTNWLQFLELSVRVVVRVYLGLFIVWLPWTRFWTDEHYLLLFPHLATVLLNGAVRGIISGLGLLNIWIGIDDAIHHNEP